MNISSRLYIFVTFSLILIFPMISQSDAFLQTGGKVDVQLNPGESYTYQWGLNSEKDKTVVVKLWAEGEAADMFEFPETLELLPNQWHRFDIVVTVPEDHPNDVVTTGAVLALLEGEKGGSTVFNIQMKKSFTIFVGNPVIEEAVAQEPVAQPVDEEPEQTKPEQPEEKGTFQLDLSSQESQQSQESAMETEEGGGCLISTATYGSELAPQVQLLREIRNNSLLTTSSGSTFMTGFNAFYYSFSPTIADWERQSPIFQEAVKLSITPLITSLSILNYVDMDSDEKVLVYGIGIILLNIGMYFVAPTALIMRLKR